MKLKKEGRAKPEKASGRAGRPAGKRGSGAGQMRESSSKRRHVNLAYICIAVLAVAAVLAIILFINSRRGGAGQVTVTEVEKGRTHVFSLFTDGAGILLEGTFSIAGKDYSGGLVYVGGSSYLFRKDPDQCIRYAEPGKILFGFMPLLGHDPAGTSANITVIKRDSEYRAVSYRIEEAGQTSIVGIEGLDRAFSAGKKANITPPENCVDEDEVFTIA